MYVSCRAAGGGGSDSLLWEANGMASKHTPACGEERTNIACRCHSFNLRILVYLVIYDSG